jgi:microcystin-dependent protein
MMMDGTIGEIRLFAGDFAPTGWMFCDGAELRIRQCQAVFSILDIQYGKESSYSYNSMTFHLPNLAPAVENDGGKFPIRYIICIDGMYPNLDR